MAENKTKKTVSSVEEFINAVDNEQKRKDSRELVTMMKQITGKEPRRYLKNLDAIDRKVLKKLVRQSVQDMREKYVCD